VPKHLVIVESPAKAKTIAKILGADYDVTSSVGHVRDLPEGNIGVDVEKDFKPKYVVSKKKKSVIDDLKKRAKACDDIYLAPDPDREGEAIAWHLREILGADKANKGKPFHRVQYNEVTAPAVRAAFENPGEVDMDRVDAQQARRVLDRLVGYTVSPMLWRRIQRGLSAGRVQSVALRLVCEREDEIDKFVPEPFWIIGASVAKRVPPKDPFEVRLISVDGEKVDVKQQDLADSIMVQLKDRQLQVKEISEKTVTRRAPAPFITSTLQQAGSTYCGFSPKRTMALAQGLYEGIDLGEGPTGLITYMRTDSFNISQEARDACSKMITESFGKEYVPEKPNVFKSRSGAQEAHEAIRPTDAKRHPDSLKGKLDPPALKLYRVIWERFVASQMAPARLKQRTVRIVTLPDGDRTQVYLLQAGSMDVVFPGFMKVAPTTKKKAPAKDKSSDGDSDADKKTEEQKLPPLEEGEMLDCLDWLCDRKETKPPSRFSEASLVREMESNGVGRPSTYAQIIATLQQREYVSSEKRSMVPTPLGRRVSALLVETLGNLFNVQFTASMEEALDEIERGKTVWTEMLRTFYVDFEKWMEGTKLPPADKAIVGKALVLLEKVQDWAPEVKRGKRTYSDSKFVESVKDQLEKGKKDISQRQLEALVTMAWRYKDQVPDCQKALEGMGFAELLASPELQPPKESTQKAVGILLGIEIEDSVREFVESLSARIQGGRRLTPAQLDALHNVMYAHSKLIPDFDTVKVDLELKEPEVDDGCSSAMLEAMTMVKEWKEPVQRGKRTFDDKAFYESLSQQYGARKYLSPRQLAALKRMVRRYREQISTYDKLDETWDLAPKKKA
jgi:DNA topoisomerase-1